MSESPATPANPPVIPPDARHLAEAAVNARAGIRWALTGYCQGQLEILHPIASLDALKRAQDNGDLALLQQYNDRRENMATGPAAMPLMATERELRPRVDPAGKLAETWKELLDKVGALEKHGTPQTGKILKYDAVWIECQYEKATYTPASSSAPTAR
jgi:hypothetical protein